jgi:hypothetical protein
MRKIQHAVRDTRHSARLLRALLLFARYMLAKQTSNHQILYRHLYRMIFARNNRLLTSS